MNKKILLKPLFFLFGLFLVFFSISCGLDEPPKTDQAMKDKRAIRTEEKIDPSNEIESANLSQKLDAINGWDTTEIFTYQLQKAVEKDNKPVSFIGYVQDITKEDSMYELTVHGVFREKHCFAKVVISADKFRDLISNLKPAAYQQICIVFEAKTVTSSLLSVDSDDKGSTYLSHDYSKMIFFRGNLIDYYLYKISN